MQWLICRNFSVNVETWKFYWNDINISHFIEVKIYGLVDWGVYIIAINVKKSI